MKFRCYLLLMLVLLATALPARATVIVAPNANAAGEGNAITTIPFSNSAFTFQWIFAASQLAGIASGSTITGIGFRIEGNNPTGPASPVTFTNWDLQLSHSLNAVGSLSATFANNIAADVVQVRSGPLTLAANSFTGFGSPNPFTAIMFDSGYTYTGGDLLITLRESGGGPDLNLDAVDIPTPFTDSVGEADFNANNGTAQFFNVPVTQLVFESAEAPAPDTLALLALALAGLPAARRRRAA